MAGADRTPPPQTDAPKFHSDAEVANSPELQDKTRATQGSDPHSRSVWTDRDRPGESDPGLRYGDAQPRRDNPEEKPAANKTKAKLDKYLT